VLVSHPRPQKEKILRSHKLDSVSLSACLGEISQEETRRHEIWTGRYRYHGKYKNGSNQRLFFYISDMVSSLDSLPSDILQHIALQATTHSYPASGTGAIVSLLLTCSTLYHALCIQSCSQLYADIFRTIFDTRAITRTFRFQVTDSQLASELVVRFQMLQRMRERTFSISELHKDLWTALWMIYESDDCNESHLQNVYISEYLLDIIKYWDIKEEGPGHQLRSLVIWILSLTLTQRKLFGILVSSLPRLFSHGMDIERILSLTANTKASLQQFLLPHSGNVREVRKYFFHSY